MNDRRVFVFVLVLFLIFRADAGLKISIEKNSACANESEIFISQNKKLIFQIPGIQNLASAVWLQKGQYQIVALTEDCESSGEIDIPDVDTPLHFAAKLEKITKNRKPSSARCEDCVPGDYYSRAFVPALNYTLPYWYLYGRQNYSNYQWPCMWNMFGCNSSYYPVNQHQLYPNGPIVMGKPNIYVQGPDAEKLRLVFLEKAEGRFMASTPAMSKNFWEFDLKKNAIFKNSVQLSYFFFDARTPTKADYNLDQAYCGQKEELLKFMIESLEARQFPKAAITDFKQHWIFKLPDVESCLFPQIEKNIQSIFPLELQKGSAKIDVSYNRIYFVAVPRSAPVTQMPLKFKSNPKKWVDRAPASAGTYQVYEWGVGFIAH